MLKLVIIRFLIKMKFDILCIIKPLYLFCLFVIMEMFQWTICNGTRTHSGHLVPSPFGIHICFYTETTINILSFITYFMYFLNNISLLKYFHIFGCNLISFITIFSFSALLWNQKKRQYGHPFLYLHTPMGLTSTNAIYSKPPTICDLFTENVHLQQLQ